MSTDTALAVIDERPQQPQQPQSYTQDDLKALRATIAKDCDDSQFKVFVAAFRRLGLDPFARQIVPIVQGGRMTPQVTIDGFRLIAERTRKYAGQLGPFWCGEDGVWHEVWTGEGNPVAARVGVIRHDFAQPLYDVAHMRSYKKNTPTWTQLPIEMLAKVAEARALRRAFPQELSGIYTDDEMPPDDPPTPRNAPILQQQRTVTADPAPQPRQERAPSAASGGAARPPTPQQIKVITQMGQFLGRGLPADLTFQTAGKVIAEWQIDMRAKRAGGVVESQPVEADEPLTFPAEGEPVPFDIRKPAGERVG